MILTEDNMQGIVTKSISKPASRLECKLVLNASAYDGGSSAGLVGIREVAWRGDGMMRN